MGTADPRKVFDETLLQLGRENGRIVAVSCDSASGGGMGGFFNAFPERSIEAGISEQNAVGICAALAKQGMIPVITVITPFLTMRAYEQIRDDVGYMNSNVKLVGSGGGLAYSTLGSTHQAVEDVALMRTIPNMTILCPCGSAEDCCGNRGAGLYKDAEAAARDQGSGKAYKARQGRGAQRRQGRSYICDRAIGRRSAGGGGDT
jgi:transketolase C-terminal domain/subunit